MQVNSSDGIISLQNISLDPIALNEEIRTIMSNSGNETANPPFVISAAVIDELRVFISFSTILTDSCRFVANGVHVSITPLSGIIPNAASSNSASNAFRSKDPSPAEPLRDCLAKPDYNSGALRYV